MTAQRTLLAQYCARLGVQPEVSPGLDSDAPKTDAPGDHRYAVGDELGRGGSARVLLGVDRSLRRTVALKVLPKGDAQDPMLVQAFLEEAIITGGLEHPNIVPAYELAYSEPIGLYYTMKRLTGRSLEKVIAELKAGAPETVRAFGPFKLLGLLVEICRGVAYAHSRGVMHTDLKPANVLIGPQGEVAVVDWGLAQVVGPAGTRQARARMLSGTPAYMSPEQINEAPAGLDFRTDVWALGVILYELLTLTRPFSAQTLEQLFADIEGAQIVPPSRRARDRPVPPEVEAICLRALERDRSRRYPSVREMLRELEEYLEGTRERRRRAEVARIAAEEAWTLIDEASWIQETMSRNANTLQNPEKARATLHRIYTGARDAILRGLEAEPANERLEQAAGELYWKMFAGLDPFVLELLSSLSERALPAIVRVGKKKLPAELPPDTHGDPWLEVVLAFCSSEPSSFPPVMSAIVANVAVLKRVPLFHAVPAAELLPIASACEEAAFDAGETIFVEGAIGTALYVVIEGRIDILSGGATLNSLGVGEVFGEIAVLGQSTRTATALANIASRCLVLEGERFRDVVKKNGEIGLGVIQVLNDRLRFATEREAALRSGVAR